MRSPNKEKEERYQRYFRIFVSLLFIIPWAILGLWWLSLQGCSCFTPRYYLGQFCVQPFEYRSYKVPWYLEFWDTTGSADGESELSSAPPTVNFMVVTQQLIDMEDELEHRQRQLNHFDSSIVQGDMIDGLGKSSMLAYYV